MLVLWFEIALSEKVPKERFMSNFVREPLSFFYDKQVSEIKNVFVYKRGNFSKY